MDFSYIALNRMMEESKKRKVIKKIKKEEKIVLSTGRKRNDFQLIERLNSFQIPLTREKLEELCYKFFSSEEMANWITEKSPKTEDDLHSDWIWICLTVLWERWYPNIPNFEMLDDKMQLGYHLRYDEKKYTEACDIWLGAWRDVLYLTEKGRFRSIDEFDDKFRGTQSLHNWCQDLELELANGGVHDRKYYRERIKYCEELINLFPHEDQSVIENMQRAVAESYFELG